MYAVLRVAILAGAFASGCSDVQVDAVEGQRYDEVNQCLAAKSVIDVIQGTPTGTCEGVRCFEADDGTEFVSATCRAPPHFIDVTADRHNRKCNLAKRA